MSKQSVGGHQVFSESECSAEYKASLACTSRYSYPFITIVLILTNHQCWVKNSLGMTECLKRNLESKEKKESTCCLCSCYLQSI